LKVEKLRDTVLELQSFETRLYNSHDGEKAAHHIRDKFIEYSNGRSDVSVELFHHTWRQPSVIARILGQGVDTQQIVILSSHEDSISRDIAAPGADDDASGTSGVLEVFRVLCERGFVPDRTVEFHTYAAEEVGLWGSQAIANTYQANGVPVYSDMQLDMTMYAPPGMEPTFGIVTDFVNANLTNFVKVLVNAYSNLQYTETQCGYGCSDHASWTKAGYASCFPFEETFENRNPYVHTKYDDLSILNMDHGLEFAKVALGYVVELSLSS